MITRAQFRTSLRSVLVDTIQFRDTQVNQWIDDAIRDYSIWLPFHDAAGWVVTAGQRWYLLNSQDENIQEVLQVEYPTGQEPRRFLKRKSERSLDFLGGAYYDVNSQNQVVTGSHLEYQFLILGETPSAGQAIWIEYTRPHEIPASDGSNITVPDAHLEVLRMYVAWRAAMALEIDETVSIVRKSEIMQTLGGSSARLEKVYREKISSLVRSSSGLTAWQMDSHDRIY